VIDDDDFESVFRKMMEHLMGPAQLIPQRGFFLNPFEPGEREEPEREGYQEPSIDVSVEEIDLGDDYMILVDSRGLGMIPTVEVRNRTVRIVFGEDMDDISIDLGFHVDIDESAASYRNGVLEITLHKAVDGPDDTIVRYIDVE